MNEFTQRVKDNSIIIMILLIGLFLYLYLSKITEPIVIHVDGATGQEIPGFITCGSDGCQIEKSENRITQKIEIISTVAKIGSIRCCRTIRIWDQGISKDEEKCRDFDLEMCRDRWYLEE